MCCTCASGVSEYVLGGIFFAEDTGDPAAEWQYYLTDPVPGGEDVPPGVTRRLLPANYEALLAHLPDCGITRRWQSQAACVAAVPVAEKAAIVTAGVPYTYDLFKGLWANESLGKSVSISATFGDGAAATVTKQVRNEITQITLTSGGASYAKLVYPHAEPTITATGPGGVGATLAVTLAAPQGTAPNQTWGVQSVSVTSGGTGYTNGGGVAFSVGTGIVVTEASATVRTREVPSHTVDASGAGGTGAAFSISYTADGSEWYIDSIAVTNGGTGYSDGGTVLLMPETGTVQADGDPSPVELSYETSGGAITSVTDPGLLYYRDRGIIQSVNVQSGGAYYVEDKNGTPQVETASVTASVSGSNAQLSATVDSNSGSGTFGQVTAINVVAANPFPPGPLVATHSSFSLDDRQFLLEQITKNAPTHELIAGPVTLADQAAIDTYLATLFSGPLDLDQLHWGYCSESTPLAGGWRLGWSTPYRKGAPLTIAAAAALCTKGSPRGYQVIGGQYVQTAWARPYFYTNQNVPPLERVVLSGSTGDAVVDALLAVIGDFNAYSAIVGANPGYSVLSGVGTPDTPQDVHPGHTEGKWCVSFSVRKTDAGIEGGYREWVLTVCWRPCVNAADNAPLYAAVPNVFVHSYSLTDATFGTDFTHLIASSADLWAYANEAACRAGPRSTATLNLDSVCGGTTYRKWYSFGAFGEPGIGGQGGGDRTQFYCHSELPGGAD